VRGEIASTVEGFGAISGGIGPQGVALDAGSVQPTPSGGEEAQA
jgi:hypothetical protein